MTRAMLLEMLEAERSRVESGFLDGVVLDAYVDKLLQHSEILIRSQGGGVLVFWHCIVIIGEAERPSFLFLSYPLKPVGEVSLSIC